MAGREPRPTLPAWSDARNILAVRLDNLGDVVMTTPALRALKQAPARPRVTLLASAAGAQAAPFIPEVDDVIRYEAAWVKNDGGASVQAAERCLAELERRRFDAAVIFTVYSQSPLPSAMLAWLAGIPLRLGHCRENPYHLLTAWIPDPEPQREIRHEVRRQLDLVASVGFVTGDERLSFAVPETSTASLRAKLAAHGVDTGTPWLVVHPGASAPSRRYPPERFAAAVRRICAETGLTALVTGSAAEAPLVERVCDGVGDAAVGLAGELAIGELAAALRAARLLVASNTGPVHVAAALGTPVVDLYALTNPQHTPWQVPARVLFHDVPCKYCYRSVCPNLHHACLEKVPPEAVVEAARELLVPSPLPEALGRRSPPRGRGDPALPLQA